MPPKEVFYRLLLLPQIVDIPETYDPKLPSRDRFPSQPRPLDNIYWRRSPVGDGLSPFNFAPALVYEPPPYEFCQPMNPFSGVCIEFRSTLSMLLEFCLGMFLSWPIWVDVLIML